MDLSGKKTVLSEGYWGEEGLAWSPDGKEVVFSAGRAYNNFSVYAVTLSGKRRTAIESAGGLTIHDTRPDGRWLATRDDLFRKMFALAPGEKTERELSWLDLSYPVALSADGKTLLFSEDSGSVGDNYAVCLRGTDGSAVVRLGEGAPQDLSPDGKWALGVLPASPQRLVLYPTGAGEKRLLESGGLVSYESARFFPDGRRLLVCGAETGRAVRCYVQEIAGGKPRPVTPEGTSLGFVSPDGGSILVRGTTGTLEIYPSSGGAGKAVPGTTGEDVALRWGADGRSIILFHGTQIPVRGRAARHRDRPEGAAAHVRRPRDGRGAADRDLRDDGRLQELRLLLRIPALAPLPRRRRALARLAAVTGSRTGHGNGCGRRSDRTTRRC